MAPATATRTRPAQAPLRAPARRAPLRVVEPRRRPPSRRRRAPVVLALVLSVGSLLMVAAAQAYLTQGQVRLARLQQQLTNEEANHRDLELQVAGKEDPSQVVTRAQQQGLTVPPQVNDVPLVTPGASNSPVSPTSAPAAKSSPTTPTTTPTAPASTHTTNTTNTTKTTTLTAGGGR